VVRKASLRGGVKGEIFGQKKQACKEGTRATKARVLWHAEGVRTWLGIWSEWGNKYEVGLREVDRDHVGFRDFCSHP
jgi:hypothetical protein